MSQGSEPDPIPESWPPQDPGNATRKVVPLFALPHVWLFPYVILPLHIFEERYKQMILDILDGPGRIVLGTVQEGFEDDLAGSPPVYPVAGLGEIGRHEQLDDGRFNILLVGLRRVRIQEVPSENPYREVEIEPVSEIPVPRSREEDLRAKLVAAILERTDEVVSIPPQVSVSHLADLLILRMPLPHQVLNDLYCELDEERRALRALEEHEIRPRLEEEEDADADAEGGGEGAGAED